jgi:predicted HTH transcriptional regulator
VWGRIDKVAFDSGLRILVFEVDARRAPHRTTDGRYYIRVGAAKREATGEEIAELYRGRTGARGFEDTPLMHADPETDIDEAALWTYVREVTAGHPEVRADYPIASLLADMRLAVRYGDDLVPTVAGILLFGKGTAVAKRIPHSPLVARRVSGSGASDQIVEEVEFVGNVASLYERAAQFVERYADLWETRPRRRGVSPVAARPYFPRNPLLEVIANALVHRDYASQSPVRLTLFDDRIDISNPAPASGLTRRALRFGVHEPTNPRLKSMFFSAAYGVTTPRGGIPMLLSATREFTRGETARVGIGPDSFRVEIPAV